MGQILNAGPCEWPVDHTCLPEAESGDGSQDAAVDLAIHVLWALSGRQFGLCPVIVRPCIPTDYCTANGPVTSYVLSREGSSWLTLACGCPGACVSSGPGMVHLPGPAQSVTEVNLGGEILDEDGYVLEGDVLYRIGANWPAQNLTRPIGYPGAWSVQYLRGNPVPPGVDKLTGLLAREFLTACAGGACRLPRTVTQVSRQGVSYQIYDPQQIYSSGKTGLSEVDLWLSAVNPNRIQQPPSVI